MRTILVLFLLFQCTFLFSQTTKIEKANMTRLYQNGSITLNEFNEYASDWNSLLQEMGGYPQLPYDSVSKKMNFKFIFNTNTSKGVTFNRILEWSAINFGVLRSILHYKDFDSGKIIVKGYFDVIHRKDYKGFWGNSKETITTTKCTQTYVFTVRDKNVKIEIVDIDYTFYYAGMVNSSIYVPATHVEYPISSLYPITNFERENWKKVLDLLNQSNFKIQSLVNSVDGYIKNSKEDYNF